METSDTKPSTNVDKDLSQSVRVAVNIRPLITPELLNGCTDCINVVPGEPQVQIGSHAFTYDYVYGGKASSPSRIFDDCVAPLVEALFSGYNATVLAYGQTGSGKTYTMGTNYNGQESNGGIIPKVMETIFKKVEQMRDSSEFLIRVSFIEIFKEEVFDLLDLHSSGPCKLDAATTVKPVAPRAPIQIRETVSGGITLAGVTEAEVKSKEEMASYLLQGSSSRATGSTNMNSQSSRSHAIFTITVEQKKVSQNGSCNGEFSNDYLCSKLHLVDLAGSERAKRTGADGMRFKEGIHINKGLLALGNVISALGDEKKRKEGGFVPYRDSKLTRLLQDSLGGNTKTVMIACVSPADTNAEETLNTLKYANRARNIQNKAVINRDPVADHLQRMRSQIEQLQTELLFYKGDAGGQYEELQILKHKLSLLEASNMELRRELQARQMSCEHLTQRAIDAQVEKDKLTMMIESARNGKPWDEIDYKINEGDNMIKSYVSKIQELEGELLRLQNLNDSKYCTGWTESDDDGPRPKSSLLMCADDFSSDSGLSDDNGIREKELEHSSLKEILDKELKELDQRLEEKEAEMKCFANTESSVLIQHYEKKILDAENEKKALMKEIQALTNKIASISSVCDDGAQKLKEEYLQKLNALESQVSVLKKKQDAQSQLLRQKQKSDEAARRLQDEIHRIKSQKVQLQHKIKQESESFRSWKAAREKEVLQLKKEGRRNEYEMHKLLALNQRQKMVLQRKTEEATMATKRLKELLESRKAAAGGGHGTGPGIQALMEAIEHELEVVIRVHEVRSQYERQMEERARMAKEIARLKEEAQVQNRAIMSKYPQTMSPGARNSRIFALENMLSTSSSTLVSMASQLSEAEERERGFGGKGRWKQVRSLADAKNLMNYLFNLASSSRCLLRDKEADCREKNAEIKDLKEKVVKLNGALRQSEMQNAELINQVKLQSMLLKNHPTGQASDFGGGESDEIGGSHRYELRNQGHRSSTSYLEDMDTDSNWSDDDGDEDWEPLPREKSQEVGGRPGEKSHEVGGRPGAVSLQAGLDSDLKPEAPCKKPESMTESSGICCSCSKNAKCKTSKCKCLNAGAYCGASCGCLSSRCSNRQSCSVDSQSPHMENEELADQEKESNALASDCAELLQNAFGEKSDAQHSVIGPKRKPLSDIGNTVAKQNVPKTNQRKKWGKQTVQIVPVAPPSSVQPETTATDKQEGIVTEGEDIPLRLPRAMRTPAFGNSNPLRERNANSSDGPSISKDNTVVTPRSPRHLTASDEKENRG